MPVPDSPVPSPYLALTQGDPAGVGPELLLRILSPSRESAAWRPLLVAERAALEPVARLAPRTIWDRLVFFEAGQDRRRLESLEPAAIPVVDPVARPRQVTPGRPGADDAAGALAALDEGVRLVREGAASALVTAPVSKESIARHCHADFRGHTGYLAAACGLERYGRDYLMAFLAAELQVALLTTHLPLAEAVQTLNRASVLEALECLHRGAGGRIAVAGLNPHAGEGGLMGREELDLLVPAVEEARKRGIDACGPESADSLFARARRGEFDWVLALYHDQGLIAVKTLGLGSATNWTLGLPFVRTSVDHGTAFQIAGRGRANAEPLRQAVETALELLAGTLPRRCAR